MNNCERGRERVVYHYAVMGYFIIIFMRYTWDKRFDDSGYPFTFSQKIKYNRIVFKTKVEMLLVRLGYLKTDLKLKMIHIHFGLRKLMFPLVIKCIVLKLKIKRKKKVEVEVSPFSESTYITYMYDGISKNYVRIRVSMHGNKNAKADVFVWV